MNFANTQGLGEHGRGFYLERKREDRVPGSSQEGIRGSGVVRCLGVLLALERQRARDVHLLSGPKYL